MVVGPMRFALVVLLVSAALYPMLTVDPTLEDKHPKFTLGQGVDIIFEVEPNNVNSSGQTVYPGDVVRGAVDMWSDEHDWFSV